jgi:hypothetical protein
MELAMGMYLFAMAIIVLNLAAFAPNVFIPQQAPARSAMPSLSRID